jgi:hypothetical protein
MVSLQNYFNVRNHLVGSDICRMDKSRGGWGARAPAMMTFDRGGMA